LMSQAKTIFIPKNTSYQFSCPSRRGRLYVRLASEDELTAAIVLNS